MNYFTSSFERLLWLSALAIWALAIPGIVAPEATTRFFGLTPAAEPLWAAFGFLLLLLVSLFFIPGALDPYHYAVSAWLTVMSSLLGGAFFLWLWSGPYLAL